MPTRSADENLHVASFTGVDLELRIVGLGGRSYAFVLDWHIRIAGAIAWYGLSSLIHHGDLLPQRIAMDRPFFLIVVLPALLIYVLYHPVLEIVMQGRTPGKRIAGVRIVSLDGRVPGAGALLIRNLLRVLDSLPSFYAVGLIAVLTTRQSMRVGDIAAGTLLVYEDAESTSAAFVGASFSAAGTGQVSVEKAALARELLQRWKHLTPAARRQLAGRLLDEDRDARAEGEATAKVRRRWWGDRDARTEGDLKQRLEVLIR